MPLGTSTSKPVRDQKARTKPNAKAQDAIKLLMADHATVEDLFKKIEKAKND